MATEAPCAAPMFSVIVPVFNRAELLAATLDSVIAQRHTDFEIIVVDDGSTDDSPAIAAAFGASVTVLRQRNAGPGTARNLGAQHATGQYLAFLDSDDLWFPWTLETYASIIRDTNSPAFIAGKPIRFKGANRPSTVPERLAIRYFRDYYASGDEWRWCGVSSFVVRRDVFGLTGGFSLADVNGEDADLAMRLGVAAGFIQVQSPVTFAYRQHAASLTSDLDRTARGAAEMLERERKGCYPGGVSRARDRRRILTRHIRPVSVACLDAKLRRDAWRFYLRTLSWHAAEQRWKYVIGFPAKALFLA